MPNYVPVVGIVTSFEDFPVGDSNTIGCYKIMSVANGDAQIINFVISPYTYFVNGAMIAVRDSVSVFYDADAPVPLIYPPQFRAVVVAREMRGKNVTVDYFDSELVNRSGLLKLNILTSTSVILTNGQLFTNNPANHYLIAVYGATTRSIPAIARPSQVIVMCNQS